MSNAIFTQRQREGILQIDRQMYVETDGRTQTDENRGQTDVDEQIIEETNKQSDVEKEE